MEAEAAGGREGSIKGSMQVPYFYSSPNLARVNVTIDVPSDSLNFNKDKGNYHSDVSRPIQRHARARLDQWGNGGSSLITTKTSLMWPWHLQVDRCVQRRRQAVRKI
jgi:hypothetical protein